MTRQIWFVLRAVAIAATVLGWQRLAYAEYVLSTTPRFSASELMERFVPLAQFLTEKLHSPVKITLTNSFQEYEKNLQSGSIDIAFSNPTHYSKATNQEVIAMESKTSGPRMRGIIIVRTDSFITSVYNLIGRSVAVVSRESTGGFLSQKVFLEERGVQVESQLKISEAHDNKQENVVLAVYQGDVDAGFINEDSLHIVDKYVPPSQIRVLESTSWLPNWALSVKTTLPTIVKERVREAILNLKPGDPVLKAVHIKEFVAATSSDYDVVRRALGVAIPVVNAVATGIQPTVSKPVIVPTVRPVQPPSVAISAPTVVAPVKTLKPLQQPLPPPAKSETPTQSAADTKPGVLVEQRDTQVESKPPTTKSSTKKSRKTKSSKKR